MKDLRLRRWNLIAGRKNNSDSNFVYRKKAADILNSYIIERILINDSFVTKRWLMMLLEAEPLEFIWNNCTMIAKNSKFGIEQTIAIHFENWNLI